MEFDIETLKEQAVQMAKAAHKSAKDLADASVNEAQLVEQKAKLAKAQRQLGVLVYTLKKSGEQNEELVQQYVDAIEEIENTIKELKEKLEPIHKAAGDAVNYAKDAVADVVNSVKNTAETVASEEEEVVSEIVEDEEAAAEPSESAEEEPNAEAAAEEEKKPEATGKVCPNCGAAVEEGSLFCNVCGAQL